MKNYVKILFALMMLTLVSLPAIKHASAGEDCTEPPEGEEILYTAQPGDDLSFLSDLGILTSDDASRLQQEAYGTRVRVKIKIKYKIKTTGGVYDDGIADIAWESPFAGQCGYDGPGTIDWND